LGAQFGIDAGGAEEEKFLDLMAIGAVDKVGLNHQVVVEEFGPVGVVGVDAADFGGGEEDVVGLLLGEEVVDGGLVAQVEFAAGTEQQVGVATGGELAYEGGTDEAVVAGDVDFGLKVHGDWVGGGCRG